MWLCDGAGDVAVYVVMHIWVHAFGVLSFYPRAESRRRGFGGGALQDLLWWRIWSVGAGHGVGFV